MRIDLVKRTLGVAIAVIMVGFNVLSPAAALAASASEIDRSAGQA